MKGSEYQKLYLKQYLTAGQDSECNISNLKLLQTIILHCCTSHLPFCNKALLMDQLW